MKKANSVLDLIGATPLIRLQKVVGKDSAAVWGKWEGANPGGSVKDRIALSMIETAEKQGLLKPGGTILEPTSGNTGIGLAMVAAYKGYKLIVTMFDTASLERRLQMQAYGAEVILTSSEDGMRGAIKKALELKRSNPEYFLPQQFINMANPEAHRQATAKEIMSQVDGPIDVFVAGVGTGGTVTGVGEILKDAYPKMEVVAIEPIGSPVLSGGEPGFSYIEGIGAGFVPEVLNLSVIDRISVMEDDNAYEMTRRLAREEGLLVGISAGANAYEAVKIAEQIGPGHTVVTILCDSGLRYLTTRVFE